MSLIEKIALKPCPFCGGAAVHTVSFAKEGKRTVAWAMWCANHIERGGECAANGPPMPTEAEAIAAWNNRAALTAIMGEGDGVQEVDKRAANDLLIGDKVGGGDGNTYVLRYPDYNGTVQAFARHRSTAAAAAIVKRDAEIVAWLREKAVYPGNVRLIHDLADAIERGEV